MKLSEFLPVPPSFEETITIDSQALRSELRVAIERQADSRYFKARKAYRKRIGEGTEDQDYIPRGGSS